MSPTSYQAAPPRKSNISAELQTVKLREPRDCINNCTKELSSKLAGKPQCSPETKLLLALNCRPLLMPVSLFLICVGQSHHQALGSGRARNLQSNRQA